MNELTLDTFLEKCFDLIRLEARMRLNLIKPDDDYRVLLEERRKIAKNFLVGHKPKDIETCVAGFTFIGLELAALYDFDLDLVSTTVSNQIKYLKEGGDSDNSTT